MAFRWRQGRTLVVGVLNATPDSFSGDGLADPRTGVVDVQRAVALARQMVADGAAVLDVGGESTRPRAEPVQVEAELARVVPVIEALRRELASIPISVDTYKAAVAEAALARGAAIVNDVSGLAADPAMAATAARHGAALVVMCARGRWWSEPLDRSVDVVAATRATLERSVRRAREAGIPAEATAVDPGIGFGIVPEKSLALLRRLPEVRVEGCALLVGTSRKRFITSALGAVQDGQDALPEDVLAGTAATVALAVAGGADAVRVHDVRFMARVARVADAVIRG